MSHDHAVTVNYLNEAIEALDAREPMAGGDLVDLWIDVEQAYAALKVVRDQLAADAAVAVADGNAAAGRKARDEYVTPTGHVVHLQRGYSREQWRGYELLGVLADKLIDPDSGEVVAAIPVDVARRTVAGCATPELTSSKWSVTGLPGGIADRYRTREETPDVIRLGERNRYR